MTSLRLDTLPAEILHRIASDGSCEDVLTLSRVNRTLNRFCYSLHVFRSVIKNQNAYGGAEWQGCPLTSTDNTASWARYALADSKARANEGWKGTARYEPQLMASHRRTIGRRIPKVGQLTADRSQALREECKATMSLYQSERWGCRSASYLSLVSCNETYVVEPTRYCLPSLPGPSL